MDRVWYFAYGSNMQHATFAERRGVVPHAALPARVAGWTLVLDKPAIVPIAHGFANLVADAASEAYGVLYELAAADMAHVELTEGVPIGNYRCVDVVAEPLDGTAARTARTLVTDARDPALRPSAHYLALLIEGATEHGLPASWIAALRAIPTAPDTDDAVAARAMLDGVLARLRR